GREMRQHPVSETPGVVRGPWQAAQGGRGRTRERTRAGRGTVLVLAMGGTMAGCGDHGGQRDPTTTGIPPITVTDDGTSDGTSDGSDTDKCVANGADAHGIWRGT